MTTANIKTALIEKVKALNGNEAKKVYGMMLEYGVEDSLFNSVYEIPDEHKLVLKKGMDDLRLGRIQKADKFIKDLRKKYA